METDSILIAETDPALLEDLRSFISSDLPWIELTVCTSLQQTVEQLSRSHYSTMIAASQMIQEEASGILLQKRKRHPLVPLVLTAGHVDREAAHDALLHREAFDIIRKPVDLTEALASIRVALWQARFLRLLTQRERRVCQFQGHLRAYPEERDRGGARGWISKRVYDTLALVRKCITVVDLHRLDALLIDLAGSVEEWTYERALDRLERMRVDRVWT